MLEMQQFFVESSNETQDLPQTTHTSQKPGIPSKKQDPERKLIKTSSRE